MFSSCYISGKPYFIIRYSGLHWTRIPTVSMLQAWAHLAKAGQRNEGGCDPERWIVGMTFGVSKTLTPTVYNNTAFYTGRLTKTNVDKNSWWKSWLTLTKCWVFSLKLMLEVVMGRLRVLRSSFSMLSLALQEQLCHMTFNHTQSLTHTSKRHTHTQLCKESHKASTVRENELF